MKKRIAVSCLAAASAMLLAGGAANAGKSGPISYKVVATNDLGMHCVCMGFDTFVLLPPFNTLRAQAWQTGAADPVILTDATKYTITYDIVQNTEASLAADPYYQSWVTNAPKLFPGFNPKAANGNYQGLTGSQLRGNMTANATQGMWEVVGVPAYPDMSSNSTTAQKIMTDPLGGPNRNPYLTASVKLYDKTTNTLLASTTTVVPAAFGGCCGCHLNVAKSYGYANPTPRDSFNVMGMLHAQNSSHINIATIDPDGDGIAGPIRCSQCHLDPAMGESVAPGYPGYPVSQYTFSDVLHRWHAQNSVVLTNYDPNIAKDCYQCHPGNNANCYRGAHTTHTTGTPAHNIWCTDCHGDLNQRIAQGQMLQPWSDTTLPKCGTCHTATGEGGGYIGGLFGKYLNSHGHRNDKILCSTCHGEPHALNPSTLAADNAENIALQGLANPIGVCDTCHTGKSTSYGKPPH